MTLVSFKLSSGSSTSINIPLEFWFNTNAGFAQNIVMPSDKHHSLKNNMESNLTSMKKIKAEKMRGYCTVYTDTELGSAHHRKFAHIIRIHKISKLAIYCSEYNNDLFSDIFSGYVSIPSIQSVCLNINYDTEDKVYDIIKSSKNIHNIRLYGCYDLCKILENDFIHDVYVDRDLDSNERNTLFQSRHLYVFRYPVICDFDEELELKLRNNKEHDMHEILTQLCLIFHSKIDLWNLSYISELLCQSPLYDCPVLHKIKVIDRLMRSINKILEKKNNMI